jgi:DNA-binding CsgD family transcriptional regulator
MLEYLRAGTSNKCHPLELIALRWKNTDRPTEHVLRGLWFSVFFFVLFTILIVIDIAHDLASGIAFYHVILELLMMLAAAFGAFYFWKWLRVVRKVESDLARDLKEARAEASRWQEEEQHLLNNLRKAINRQFTQWNFSSTDKEIAFYLLKGLSLKEIAKLRGSTFNSIRQQAHVLYSKAGLGSRAELSAFFLGELLQPEVTPDKNTDPAREEDRDSN